MLTAMMKLSVVLGLAAMSTPAIAGGDGAALYSSNCASCHGADGSADTPVAKAMSVPGLKGISLSAEAIAAYVTESDKHTAQADKLTPEDLAAIGAFVVGGFQ